MNLNKELLEKKYQEMKSQKIDEDFLDEKLGEIKVYINKKPKKILFNFNIEADEIYIGTN
jgi:hypothetical protein